MNHEFGGEKMLPDERHRIRGVIDGLNEEWKAFGVSFALHEESSIDTYSIVRTDREGNERIFWFTKMGAKAPVEGVEKGVDVEKRIEARLRFPDLDATEALERLAEFKKKDE